MARTTIIYLARHGESEFNLARKVSGHANPSLTVKGRAQAKELRETFRDFHFDEVYSSDLHRAYETAELVFGFPVPESHRLPGLRERHYGILEEKPDSALDGWHEKLTSLPSADCWHYRHVESMETDHELMRRFIVAITEIAAKHPGKTVLIVGHGSAIRTLLFKLQYADHEDIPPKAFKNAGFVELSFKDPDLKVVRVEGIDRQVVERSKKLL